MLNLRCVLDHPVANEPEDYFQYNHRRECRQETGQTGPSQSPAEPAVGRVQHRSQKQSQHQGRRKRPGNPQQDKKKGSQQEAENGLLFSLRHTQTSNTENYRLCRNNLVAKPLLRGGFHSLLDCSQATLERRTGFAHSNFAHNTSFQSRETGLLRRFHCDQIKAVLIRASRVSYADRQIKRTLKIVAGVHLFQSHRVNWIRWVSPAIDDLLHNSQSRFQSKIYFFPIERWRVRLPDARQDIPAAPG